MIKGISHNAMRVTDMEKSLRFYCDIAGLTKAFEIRNDTDQPWIVYLYAGQGQFLELFYDGVKVPENRYAADLIGYHHFCFETDRIEELAKRFHAHGYMNSDQPGLGKDLNRNSWIHDPDGNAVEFVQLHPDSAHARSSTAPFQPRPNGIAHLAFVVSDMEKALGFYRDTLGFELAFDLDDDEGRPWINYLKVADGQFVELFYGGSREYVRHPHNAGSTHVCFEVDDIFGTALLLEQRGVKLDIAPKQGKDGNYQCWAKDPDGFPIEFMQLNPQSPQAITIAGDSR